MYPDTPTPTAQKYDDQCKSDLNYDEQDDMNVVNGNKPSRGRQLPGRDAQGRAAPIKTELDIAKHGKPVFLDNAAHDFDEGWTINTLSSPSTSNSPRAVQFRPNLAESPDFDVNDRNIDSLDFDDFERLMPYEFSEDSKGVSDLNPGDVRNSFSKYGFYGSIQLEAAAPAYAAGVGERPPPAPDPSADEGELTGELTAAQLPPPTPLQQAPLPLPPPPAPPDPAALSQQPARRMSLQQRRLSLQRALKRRRSRRGSSASTGHAQQRRRLDTDQRPPPRRLSAAQKAAAFALLFDSSSDTDSDGDTAYRVPPAPPKPAPPPSRVGLSFRPRRLVEYLRNRRSGVPTAGFRRFSAQDFAGFDQNDI